uniref:Uncharacterized protein n=1 Tax=Arundo donax TaxID=35708 RepID=A0A0A9FID4_ARUDO
MSSLHLCFLEYFNSHTWFPQRICPLIFISWPRETKKKDSRSYLLQVYRKVGGLNH